MSTDERGSNPGHDHDEGKVMEEHAERLREDGESVPASEQDADESAAREPRDDE